MRMFTLLVVGTLALAGCTTSDPSPQGNGTNDDGDSPDALPVEETWFLHSSDEDCDGSGSESMDKNDSVDGGADGCGAVGAPGLMGGFVVEFPASVNSTGAAKDTPFVGSIFLTFANPGQYTVDVVLKAGGKTVGSATVTAVAANAFGGFTPWTEFAFDETLSGAIEAGSEPKLSVTVSDTASYFFGYDGDHASQFTLG